MPAAACPSACGWTVAEESGLEFSYLLLGQNTQTYSNASTGNPILARPFFDVNPAVAARGFATDCLSRLFRRHLQRHLPPRTSKGPRPSGGERSSTVTTGRSTSLPVIAIQTLTDGLEIADSVTTFRHGQRRARRHDG